MAARRMFALMVAGGLFWLPAQGAENLLALYHEAKANNAGFLAVQAEVRAEHENEAITRGQLLPSLTASSTYSRNHAERQIGSTPADSFDYDSSGYSLGLRQPLFRKYNFAAYAQAKAQGEAADAQLQNAANDLVLQLAQAYMDVLFADDQIRLHESQKAAIAAQLAAAEKAVVAGSGTRIDVDEARASLDMALAREVELLNLRQHNRRLLAMMVGREVGDIAPLDLKRFQHKPPAPADANAWVAEAEKNNAEYQNLLAQRKAAEQEVEKARAGHYPTLDLVASSGRSSNDNISTLNKAGDSQYKTRSVGLQLNIPLFAGFQVNATVRQAEARLEQVRQQCEDSRRKVGVQTRREYDNVVQGMARIRALQQAAASSAQTILSARKGVEAGVRTTLDVLQTEYQHYKVLSDLAQARYSYLIAEMKLKGLSGSLAEGDVENLNARLHLY